jgi:hypothetical protein
MLLARYFAPVVLALAASGCAVRAPQVYRLVPAGNERVLTPPGVVSADTALGNVTVKLAKKQACAPSPGAITVERHGGTLRLTVTRDSLLRQPKGWLRQWTAEAESQGCIPAGTSMELAERILESLPLDPSAAYRLMHGDSIVAGFVELGPQNRLQTMAPIMKSGNAPEANKIEITSVTGSDRSLNVDIRESDEAIGVETSWYALQPKPAGPGSTIVPLSAERRIEDQTTPVSGPMGNYFPFAPDIGFYRLIYKTDTEGKGAITEIVVGAPNLLELERRTRQVLDDFNTCRVSDPEMCAVIPRRVALNAVLAVTVNGKETRIGLLGTVRSAILQGGGPRRADDVLPTLSVRKLYNGKLVDVQFDHARGAILDVTLLGGEAISWQIK